MDNKTLIKAEHCLNDFEQYPKWPNDDIYNLRINSAVRAYTDIGISCERVQDGDRAYWRCYEI